MEVRMKLMDTAKDYMVTAGIRHLVPEIQSCNYPAISFYLKHGFEFAGFDTSCYLNRDIEKHEFSLEFRYLF